jgi:diguanylate cyclase (GGDEF)-like protein/PAS domain S-box-containing protein
MLYQRLLGSAEALQKIIDIIPSPVFVKDTRHRWVLVNDALAAALGKPREDLLGLSDFDVFPPEEAAAFWAGDDAVFASGQSSEHEERMTDASGRVRLIVTRKSLLRVGAGGGTLFLVGIFTDVTSYRESVAHSHFISRHDPLTQLPNRILFNEQLAEAITYSNRVADGFAVLLVDLDGFKAVNDAFGHAAGDALLRVIAERLTSVVRASDLVARIGGDEFGILVRGGPGVVGAAERIAGMICDLVMQPVHLDACQTQVSASVGITYHTKPETKPEELLRQADIAMYSVKRAGRHGHRAYEPELEHAASRQLHADMRTALERHELYLMYQPLWNPPSGELTGYEALLRWEHPTLGNISPGLFIPIAEQSGLIAAYGNFALHAACKAALDWPPDTRVCVNISPVQLVEDKLAAEISAALVSSRLPPARLEIELTESKPALDGPGAARALAQVAALGVRIALDDFGTGTASLDMMHRFAFHRMKIDQRFVKNLPMDLRGRAIVSRLISLAHDLGASVTAEGVERMEQAFCLMELGCDEMQGYLFGHPAVQPSVL